MRADHTAGSSPSEAGHERTSRSTRARLLGSILHSARGWLFGGVFGVVLVCVLVVCVSSAGAVGFGVREGGFVVSVLNRDGTPDTQAGSHPYEFSVETALNTELVDSRTAPAGGEVRDLEVSLPAGFVGDPTATPQCPLQTFREVHGYLGVGQSGCPADSQLGIAELQFSALKQWPQVFNLVPPRGMPAEFGFVVLGTPVVLVPSVRTGSDYGVNTTFSSIPEGLELTRGKLTLWGVPGDAGHDGERGECWGAKGLELGVPEGGSCPSTVPARPFLSLPTSCGGRLQFGDRVDSWEAPGAFVDAQTTTPALTGCEKLEFAPQVVAQPEPAQAASPSGLSVEIQVPQTYENPVGLAEANLKNTTVTLPAGVAVNPSAADGLAACSEEQIGLHEASEPSCPDASKVGSVEITTPLLQHPLTGAVYLAQQGNLTGNGSNPFGSLLALYLAVKDPYSGVLVKLAGEVKPDPFTGQLVTTFLNNPQVPFDSLRLSFFGGPRAALVNPPLCGTYTTSTEMTPWSGGASATPSWAFAITSGPNGGACSASQPFSPQLVSGTKSNQAGGFSPFSLTFFRTDAEQNLARIQVTTPVGLLGTLANVALCGEPQAQQGTCGPESEIGHVTVGVGAGSNPFYVTGKVFLTVSYDGAPFGLSFVVPAVAGPLNLGNVVVRAAVNGDPQTAALTRHQRTAAADPAGRTTAYPCGQRHARPRTLHLQPHKLQPPHDQRNAEQRAGSKRPGHDALPGNQLRGARVPADVHGDGHGAHLTRRWRGPGRTALLSGCAAGQRGEHREGQGRTTQAATLAADDAPESVPRRAL